MVANVTAGASISLLIDAVHAQFDQADVLVKNAYSSGETFDMGAF